MSVFDPFEYEYETYPLIRTKKQVDKLQKGQALKVRANEPVAPQNIDSQEKKAGKSCSSWRLSKKIIVSLYEKADILIKTGINLTFLPLCKPKIYQYP